MKPGLAIEQLAQEIVRQNGCKTDYIVSADCLRFVCYGEAIYLRLLNERGSDQIEPLDISPTAHRQIGVYLSIPAKYYAKMREEAPALLTENVNTWLQKASGKRMLRLLDGAARAFLSNRYFRMDHYPVSQAIIPMLGEMPRLRFESCQITPSRMYIKVVNPLLQAEVTPGDSIQAGLMISNSEVGLGSLSVQPMVYREQTQCAMYVSDAAAKRSHVGPAQLPGSGAPLGSGGGDFMASRGILEGIRAAIRMASGEEQFQGLVAQMRQAKTARISADDPALVLQNAARDFGIIGAEQPGILRRLSESNDLTQYGLANAVAQHSQDVASYDRATELEGIGYQIMTMPPVQWTRINQAA